MSICRLTPLVIALAACHGGELPDGEMTASCHPGQASAQFRAQDAPTTALGPSVRAPVSLTFDNCSGMRWTATDFALFPQLTSDDGWAWGNRRVALPADVPDGAEVVIPFEIVAPPQSGSYDFAWAIARDDSRTLEEHSPTVKVAVVVPADCSAPGPIARFRGQVAPSDFVPTGAAIHASVTFDNCGTVPWTRAGGFRLGSQADQDNTVWGMSRVELPNDVAPGTQVTIPIEATAPTQPGAYRFAWKIVEEGVKWIDEGSPVVNVTALVPYDCSAPGPLARYLSQNAPGTLDPNQTVGVSVRYANCSGVVWDSSFHLAAAAPANGGTWGVGSVALPLLVGDSFSIDVPFSVHAPGAQGQYEYRWAIFGESQLDEPTPDTSVTVRCAPACGNHNCGGDGCGGSCGSCGGGSVCDGAHCQSTLSCGHLQWWNSRITWTSVDYGWNDTDLGVSSSTPVQLRHPSQLYRHGVYGWGYMPEFVDLVTGDKFRFLHLRPQDQWATSDGTVYPEGYVVGLSGGDTYDTGYPTYSTGPHLCVQTLAAYRSAFPAGWDPCH